MGRGSRAVATVFILAAVLAAPSAAVSNSPAAETGRFAFRALVTRVVDGDTLRARLASGRGVRVRLIGIDSPELADCYFDQANARARQLAQGKRVRLIGDSTQATYDRYGRLRAYVALPGGADLGRQLIAGGFGRVFVFNDVPFQRVASYRAAERAAQGARRGLWRSCPTGLPLRNDVRLTPVTVPSPASPPAPPPPPVVSPPPPSPTPPVSPPPVVPPPEQRVFPPIPDSLMVEIANLPHTTAGPTPVRNWGPGPCHPSYTPLCFPSPPPVLDCITVVWRNFTVRHDVADPDPQRFDGDKDGIGCES